MTWRAALVAALLAGACTAQSFDEGQEAAQGDGTGLENGESALLVDPTNTMIFTAHEDDDYAYMPDLLFTLGRNPDSKIISVTMTAGDADFTCAGSDGCDDSYIVGREQGQLAGYAKLFGVDYPEGRPEAVYAEDSLTVNGKTLRRRKLNNGRLDVVYFGFPANERDPNLMSLWQAPSVTHSIYTLGPVPHATAGGTVGGCDTRRSSETYTRSELIETLRQLMALYGPTQLNTMDSGRLWPEIYPFEHVDHSAVSLFALAASQRYQSPHALRTYRTYNINVTEPANVATDDAAHRLLFLNEYAKYDAWMKNCQLGTFNYCGHLSICQAPGLFWGGFEDRQYTVSPVQGTGVTGAIASADDRCLAAAGPTGGAAIALAACSPTATGQEWNLRPDGTIRAAMAPSLCMTAPGASSVLRFQSPASAAPGLSLQPCAASGSTAALDQQFLLMSSGQLHGPDASCLESAGSALSVKECRNAPQQLGYRMQFYARPSAAAKLGYGELEIPNRFDVYHAISYGDLDGGEPWRADVCVRRVDGVWCSKSTGTAFGEPARFTADFADTATANTPSFRGAPYGSTVQLADIDHDGKADVCGRGPDGVYCARGTGSGFQAARKWSSGSDFSDAAGYAASAGRYGSLHLPDLDHDGYADLCARNARGIECALNAAGNGMRPATQWLRDEFTDDKLWNNESSGGTVQFADVDGDGFPEVCGRATDGIRCAINNFRFGADPHFVTPHLFGASDDFDDLTGWGVSRSYYGSIHLADINGDQRADVCGRGSSGLRCGVSMGSSFAKSQPILSRDGFADLVWSAERYGSTVQLADIDGDGRADACGRGPLQGSTSLGLVCALGL